MQEKPETKAEHTRDMENQHMINDLGVLFNFIEISPIYMHIYCNDKIVFANRALLDKLGYTLDEIRHMNFWDIVHTDQRQFIKKLGRARQEGGTAPRQTEIKILTRQGKAIWMDLFTSTEIINNRRHVIVGGYDITNRKKVEREFQKARDEMEERVHERTKELQIANDSLTVQQQMLMGIVSNISNGVMIVNDQGELEFSNPTIEKMLGMTGNSISERYKSRKLTIKCSALERVWQDQADFKDEEASVIYGHKEWRFLISVTPIKNQDRKATKVIIVFRALSEVHKLVTRFSGAVARFKFEDIITRSEQMAELIRTAKMASKTTSNVMIEGESGTGKELFAQAIHNQSPCADGPFIAVNCGAIPRELIGSELFGYEEGAFTGARKGGSPGKFELAEGGTLFLDEIGDMPIEQQVTLLRVLQEKQVTRIGGSKVIPVDVRIICATNRNLFIEVQKERFRQDLYYRLNVINLRIPPLRERREDISLLLKTFLCQIDPEWEGYVMDLNADVIEILKQYDWPGNVRELQNVAERIAYTHKNYQVSSEKLLDNYLKAVEIGEKQEQSSSIRRKERVESLEDNVKARRSDFESEHILFVLKKCGGNVTQAARDLGIARRTLYRKIEKYQLSFR